jgi:hypothetical protein
VNTFASGELLQSHSDLQVDEHGFLRFVVEPSMETPVGSIATINMLQFSPQLEYMDTAKLDVTTMVMQDGLTVGGAEEICEGYVCQWQAAITVMPDL